MKISIFSRAFSGFRGWADDGEEEGDEVSSNVFSSNRVFVEVVLVSSVEQEEGWGVKALCWASAGSKTTAIENTLLGRLTY